MVNWATGALRCWSHGEGHSDLQEVDHFFPVSHFFIFTPVTGQWMLTGSTCSIWLPDSHWMTWFCHADKQVFSLTLPSRWTGKNVTYSEAKLIYSDYLMAFKVLSQVFSFECVAACMERARVFSACDPPPDSDKRASSVSFPGFHFLHPTPQKARDWKEFYACSTHGNGISGSWASFPALSPTSSVLPSPLLTSVTPPGNLTTLLAHPFLSRQLPKGEEIIIPVW